MDRLNIYYYNFLLATMLAYTINVGLMVKILYTDCHSFIYNFMFYEFCSFSINEIIYSFIVARESVKNDKMMSAL